LHWLASAHESPHRLVVSCRLGEIVLSRYTPAVGAIESPTLRNPLARVSRSGDRPTGGLSRWLRYAGRAILAEFESNRFSISRDLPRLQCSARRILPPAAKQILGELLNGTGEWATRRGAVFFILYFFFFYKRLSMGVSRRTVYSVGFLGNRDCGDDVFL